MVACETLEPRWHGPCIVAATGRSLLKDRNIELTRGHHIIAIKQANEKLPWADAMYANNAWWWDHFYGCPNFKGEKWSSHQDSMDNKLEVAKKYGLHLVRGEKGSAFSSDPKFIHFGQNSGFQAVNMAIHWLFPPRKLIILVAFDFKDGYFYGNHPKGQRYGNQYAAFIPIFEAASKSLPPGVEIINASPKSLLTCFPRMPLEEALKYA